MKINIKETLKFFDDKTESRGHATSIVGVLGEDLNALVFKNYLETMGNKVKIFDGPVSQGATGRRLDRWIYVERKNGTKTLYQCEIKSWSATALDGRSLALEAKDEEIKKISRYHWEQQKKVFSKDTDPNYVTKVLLPMNPKHNENVKQYIEEQKIRNYQQKPLLIYWMPISLNEKNIGPFSTEKIANLNVKFSTNFLDVDIFSVSLYFRSILDKGEKFLSLNMSNAQKRIDILNKIIMSL